MSRDAVMHVLIVDDEPVRCELFERLVMSQPHMEYIGTALNERGLFDCLQHLSPDVIVMSVLMGRPGHNCVQLTRLAQEFAPDAAIIWCGGNDDWTPLAEAAGIFAFMPKPLNLKALVALIYETQSMRAG